MKNNNYELELKSSETLEKLKLKFKNINEKSKKSKFTFGINLIINKKVSADKIKTLKSIFSFESIPFMITEISNFYKKINKTQAKLKAETIINIFYFGKSDIEKLSKVFNNINLRKSYDVCILSDEIIEIPNVITENQVHFDEIWISKKVKSNNNEEQLLVGFNRIPYIILNNKYKKYERKHFRLPKDKFLFLVIADNNTENAKYSLHFDIKTFKKAFSKTDQRVSLVISLNNGNSELKKHIQKELDGYKNYIIIDRKLKSSEKKSLISVCDIYVSLSESFDNNILESMSLKTPVLAAYNSENSDFILPQTACCVDFTDEKKQGVLKPDVVQASVFMKLLKEDVHFRKILINLAYKFVTKRFSSAVLSKKILERINELNKKA